MAFEEHTIHEPLWIKSLIEDVVISAFTPLGFIGPLGYRWWEPGNRDNTFNGWQIVVFPTPNEIRGPVPHDGCKYVGGFRLDVGHVMGVMTTVEAVAWNSPNSYNGDLDGPELGVKGMFAGKRVWLRFFHLPPPDEPCSFYIDPTTGQTVEKQA